MLSISSISSLTALNGIGLDVIVLATAISICYFVFTNVKLYLTRRQFKKDNGCQSAQTKYPLKDPIFGTDLILSTIKNAKNARHLEGTAQRYEDHGTTFTSRLVNCPTVFTIEPENVKTMLATKFEDYRLSKIRVDAMRPVFGHGIFTTDGPIWKNSRALLRPIFDKESISDLNLAEVHFQHLLRRLPRDGSTVDLQQLFFNFTMDTATQFLFGHSVNTQFNSNNISGPVSDADFAEQYGLTQTEASHMVRLGPLNRLRKQFSHISITSPTWRLKKPRIKRRGTARKAKRDRTAFLKNSPTLLPIAKSSETNLLAGRDTTASLLSNLFFMLARYPDVFEKLRAEVMTLNGQLPSYDELRNLKYLRQCINESTRRLFDLFVRKLTPTALRIHPVAPANTREAVCDTVLPKGGGEDGESPLFVKSGTQVLYSVYSMHRRKDIFGEDVENFRPERLPSVQWWSENLFRSTIRTHGSLLCYCANVARISKIEPRDDEEWKEAYTLVVCSQNGTQVSLTPAA
ncbi:cytochrome P450 alkane hydroxylase protein [Rutstroemia sp. NJR-2017a BVV2]|nr:cytochrome P450 alkane hydroxylase protein [Rutstroemia sp. NJR-2017a BVV2]